MAYTTGTLGKKSVLTGTDVEDNTLWGDTDDALPEGNVTRGGNDSLTGGTLSYNELYGDAFTMSDDARSGNDYLTGGANSRHNYLYGDAHTMAGNAKGGNDSLTGGANTFSSLYGDAYQVSNDARGGNDDETGGDSIIAMGGSNTIAVADVTDLTPDDFLFVA